MHSPRYDIGRQCISAPEPQKEPNRDADAIERQRAKNRRHYLKHREERLAWARIYRSTRKAELAAKERARRAARSPEERQHVERLRLYGVTPEQYTAMHEGQAGLCAICGKPRPLVIDHCHTTRVVRGLLCHNCNKGLGMFADDPATILAAWRYLTGVT